MTSEAAHPVIEAIQRCIKTGSTPGYRDDDFLIALAIEGGAIRGVVTNGMIGPRTPRGTPSLGRFEKNAESLRRVGAEASDSVFAAFSSAEPKVS